MMSYVHRKCFKSQGKLMQPLLHEQMSLLWSQGPVIHTESLLKIIGAESIHSTS